MLNAEFSSPVGVFFLFIVPLAALDMLNAEFSSPVGVFFLFIYPKINKTLTFIMFSSPVGVFFLSIENDFIFHHKELLFSSPVGVFFLFILPFVRHYLTLFQRSIACEMNLSLLFNDNTIAKQSTTLLQCTSC